VAEPLGDGSTRRNPSGTFDIDAGDSDQPSEKRRFELATSAPRSAA